MKVVPGIACTLVALAGTSVKAQTSVAPVDTVIEAALDTGYMTYDEDWISLPLGIGFRVPAYDRVDGLVLPWGPKIRVPGGRIDIDPTVTYRSHLGAIDPSASVTVRFGHVDRLEVRGGRETFTNDRWIRSDLISSLAAIGVGSDARNYFRADRVTARLEHDFISGALTITPSIGILYEDAWSTGSAVPHTEAPWSVFGRADDLRMRRINPAIFRGNTTYGTGGVALTYERDELKGNVDVGVERTGCALPGSEGDPESAGSICSASTQTTIDAKAAFPTFGTQRFEFRGHGVMTAGDPAPPQRFAYLGGAGTLATVDLLALGGDRLLYVEGQYELPLVRPILPLVGAPVLSARYAAGSAGIDELPDLIQNIGVGIGVKLIKVEYHIDPNYRKTPYTHKSAFSVGISLSL